MIKFQWHLKRLLRKFTAKIDQQLVSDKQLIVIANNCFGGEIYKRLNIEFNTPFIGLFIYGSDYIKLLVDLDDYMSKSLRFISQSRHTQKQINYPIGLLGDVEIHFMHYKSAEEALAKWERRLKRFKTSRETHKLIIKFCDRDGATMNELYTFHQLPFHHKISFGVNPFACVNHIQIKESDFGRVPDGVILYVLCQSYFDIYYWIRSNRLRKHWYSTLKSKLDIA